MPPIPIVVAVLSIATLAAWTRYGPATPGGRGLDVAGSSSAMPQNATIVKQHFDIFNIASTGMAPTLRVAEVVRADMTYYDTHPPKRGDVVVFRWPQDPTAELIKRIVGVPGDRVQMINERLYINGQELESKALGNYPLATDGQVTVVREFLETLPNGRKHYVLKETPEGYLNNTPEFRVPEGHVFVMGDNRDNSSDSRGLHNSGEVRFVPVQNLVARVEVIYWSPDVSRINSTVD